MSYYWFNRETLLKNTWDKYHNKGGKEKATKYYAANKNVLREDARNKYRLQISCQRQKKIKKEISKREIPHEY